MSILIHLCYSERQDLETSRTRDVDELVWLQFHLNYLWTWESCRIFEIKQPILFPPLYWLFGDQEAKKNELSGRGYSHILVKNKNALSYQVDI